MSEHSPLLQKPAHASVLPATSQQAGGHQGPLHWERDGRDWPNRVASRFVMAGGIRWHVQVLGSGPALLLLHGTGAASHSWRGLAPLLARHYTVVAPDLPGHGFTEAPSSSGFTLTGMASLLAALLRALQLDPKIVVGHSAGAAVGVQMCLDDSLSPDWLVSINGALMPLSGFQGRLFAPLARFLAQRRLWARLFARHAADGRVVERLIARTGSTIDSRGVALYARLLRHPGHNAAALAMMANWDLDPLLRDLPTLRPALLLLVGENDRMVPPEQAELVRARLPTTRIRRMTGCGHLLHEEKPEETAASILSLRADDEERHPS